MQKHVLPKGFLVNGIHCGVKKKRKDLSLFYSESPCNIASLFTKNKVKAAPVVLAKKQLKKNAYIARGVIVNSGNANCMTAKQGMVDAKRMARETARLLKLKEDDILVSSTGIIGKPMLMKPIIEALPVLVKGLSRDALIDAAFGIMTTDRFVKISSRIFTIDGKSIVMTGVAKGAGMIKPDMATMLCYILTDAAISKRALNKALVESASLSFNAITVDGDMSTNDTLMILANAKAGNEEIEEDSNGYKIFQGNLISICTELAKLVVLDGEGASKLIEIHVKGAKSKNDAKKAASAIANSLLVKCAVHGGDPNWGRIASSVGASGADFNPDRLEISLDGQTFFRNGKALILEREHTLVFKGKQVNITVNLHNGKEEVVEFSCDISKKYITLNSYYTT